MNMSRGIQNDIRNPAVSSTHLLNRITDPLKNIHILTLVLILKGGYATKTAGWSSAFFAGIGVGGIAVDCPFVVCASSSFPDILSSCLSCRVLSVVRYELCYRLTPLSCDCRRFPSPFSRSNLIP
jgi:hypothetical protein